MGNIVFGIIVVIFIISAVKRMLESVAREADKNAPQRHDFEASHSEVEEFLRGLQQARRQQAQAGRPQGEARPRQAQVQARPAGPRAPLRRSMAPGAPLMEEALLTGEGVAPQPPAVRPVRVRRHKRGEDDVVEELVATEPVKESPPPEPKRAAVTVPELKKMSLKDAVIWSEILGAPLSKRPRGGRRAGPMGR